MGKDEIKSNDYCPDCAAGEAASEPDATDTECCCCCCSCCESGSESEINVPIASEGNQTMANLEQRKKEMLSNLSILKTNREQVSVQHLLQFIEALNHSPDFLRRYNLQEEFCLECLLSEPACTCCITGVSQMNLNDESCNSCDECNRDESLRQERYSSHGCSDCFSMQKASICERPPAENRRGRRRRQRRQRHNRHILPRVSVANVSHPGGTSSTHLPQLNISARRNRPPNTVSMPRVNQNEIFHDNDSCDECRRPETFTRRNSPELRRSYDFERDSINEDSDFCGECSRTNSLSSSCTVPGCNECESKRHQDDIQGNSSLGEGNRSCTCCINSPKEFNLDKNSKVKKENVSSKAECDKNEVCSDCSSCGSCRLSGNCSCEECQENSDCSEESCSECKNHNFRERKSKK